ncbi:MAG: hypothetical protein Kow00106_24890 [Anaerolineae bacterium]
MARLHDKKVLLVGIDHQANSSKVIPQYPTPKKEETIYRTIPERQPLPIRPTSVAQLDMVPAQETLVLLAQLAYNFIIWIRNHLGDIIRSCGLAIDKRQRILQVP